MDCHGPIRVAFHASFRFHEAILGPIRDTLGGRAETLLTADRVAVVAFAPHVVAMAAGPHLEYFRYHLPGAFLVNVRHGMIGKAGLRRRPARASARVFDAVCVGDELKKATYERAHARPLEFWETGYPQLDPLFRRDRPPALPLPGGRPTVLYAPTWNLGLTSATMLGPRLVELVRAEASDVNVLIKPHPVIADWHPRWMSMWARLAAEHRGVHLVLDTHADVVPYLLASDALVSDASSVIFEFLALDRPVVLITNPRRAADPAWAPDDIVWRWRDLGDEIHDVRELPAAVAEALRHPDRHAERRRAYADVLFGRFTDGRSHQRIAERLLDAGTRVLRGAHRVAPRPPRVAFLAHDLRTVLGAQAWARRLFLVPLERARLAVRGWRRPPSRVAAGGTALFPG